MVSLRPATASHLSKQRSVEMAPLLQTPNGQSSKQSLAEPRLNATCAFFSYALHGYGYIDKVQTRLPEMVTRNITNGSVLQYG